MKLCKVIFAITFSQTIRSKKTIFMTILAFLPVLLAAYYRISGREEFMAPDQALSHFMMFYLLFLSTLVALFYGTAIVADEIDNGTIICLFTRPVRKYWIVIGKLAAYMSGVLLIMIPPVILTFLIVRIGSNMPSSFSDSLSLFCERMGLVILALVVYGIIFMFLGAWRKHSVLIGLVFAFGWEKMILAVPGIVRKFSVVHYLFSAYPEKPMTKELNMFPEGMISYTPVFTSIIILLAIAVAFLGLTIFTIYRKEYRSDIS